MRFLDLTFAEPADNVALDEALLLEAEAGHGGAVLRVWEYPAPVVVLGSNGLVEADVERSTCAADGVPLLRRSSGGGTVLWGRGCLLYSLVLPYDLHPALSELSPSYRFILDRVLRAIEVPGAEQVGISDLAVGGRKFSGNAQQRKRNHLLHHGTLLYDFDLDLLSRYLKQPPRQPDYRAQRSHRDFVGNLARPPLWLQQRLRQEWQAEEALPTWPAERVAQLVTERYATAEWTFRR
jgi:lipoate-protein ligase A